MAFTPSTLGVIVQPIGGDGMRFISYRTDDDQATVSASDYFARGAQYGIRVNDLIFVSALSVSFDPYILVVNLVDGEGNVSAAISDEEMPASVYDPDGTKSKVLFAENDLADIASPLSARDNLDLGTAAVADADDFATEAQGAKADSAVQPTETDASGYGFVVDEDDMASDSATKVPTQQSVVAYLGGPITIADAAKTLQVKADGSGYEVGVEPQEKSANLQVISDGTAADYRKTLAFADDGTLAKLTRPFYNPYDYGATGLPAGDDTAALALCLAEAKANAGIQTNPKGRGTIIIPPGNFCHTGFKLDVDGLKIVGLGGTLDSIDDKTPALEVAASHCTAKDLTLLNRLLPTTDFGCLEHSDGADSLFSNITAFGGWYGFKGYKGSSVAVGDSTFFKFKTAAGYSHCVYLDGYTGYWGYRDKHDNSWPVQEPVSDNYIGAYTPGVALVVGDVVENGNWAFQVRVAGTPTETSIPATIFGADVDIGGDCIVRMAMRKDRAGMQIESDVFNVRCDNGDFTGGHYFGLVTQNVTGTFAPQTLNFEGGGEFGGNLIRNVWGKAASNLTIAGMTVDGAIIDTGLDIDLADVRIARLIGNTHHGSSIGVQMQSGINDVIVRDNYFGGYDTCVKAITNAKHFKILGNNLGGIDGQWGVNDVPYNLGTGTDHCWVRDNTIDGATSDPVDSNPTRENGSIGDNL